MISCEEALELLSLQLDGALTSEQMQALDAHLASCPSCRTIQEELRAVDEALPALEQEPPAQLRDGVMRQIRRQSRHKKEQTVFLRFVAVCAAAAALLALLSGFHLVSIPSLGRGEASVSMGESLWPKTQTPAQYAAQLSKQSGKYVLLVEGCGAQALDGAFEDLGRGLYLQETTQSALDALESELSGTYAVTSFGTRADADSSAYLLCTD